MYYYIVEHPTRGILTVDSEINQPRFQWSKPRGHEDNMRSYSLEEADETLEQYAGKYADKYTIVRSPDRARGETDWTNARTHERV